MEAAQSNITLGERIRTARKRTKASQAEIAEVCDTTRQQVGKWELGIAVPDVVQLVKLANYTRHSLDWFTKDLVIELSDQPVRPLSCNFVEQLDLFSPAPQAADVRSGGALWEYSDRTSADTSRSAESVARSLGRQLVA